MKDKFIRVLSPAATIFVIVLDFAVIWYAVFSVKKIAAEVSLYSVVFLVIEFIALIIAVFVTKEIFTQGVWFRADSLEFTALDENNTFFYDDIEKTDIKKDKKASLVKNFNDRHSYIEFFLKDGKTVTVDIGLTTMKTLKKINAEIGQRIK